MDIYDCFRDLRDIFQLNCLDMKIKSNIILTENITKSEYKLQPETYSSRATHRSRETQYKNDMNRINKNFYSV